MATVWRRRPKNKIHLLHREHKRLTLCGQYVEGGEKFDLPEGAVGICCSCKRAARSVESSR